ncbi:MAG TPA: glycoside hydrolase family 99-like domain-containing protein [Verrucomicrobiae bacterium]
MFVSVDGGPEHLFSEGATGSARAEWIEDRHSYEFRLYAGHTQEKVLATTVARMDHSANSLGPVYASKMIREVNTYAAADAVLSVSQKESNLINDLIGNARLAYTVPDYDDLAASRIPMRQRKGILFVGNFNHAPNESAVERLCRDIAPKIHPAVLEEHPIYIVGNGLGDKIRRYGEGVPHVHMIGWVPSVVPYLERCKISVVPLTYGAGTKRKLLHALMVGTPTVTTSVGIEGLGVKHGEHVLVADASDTFAEAVMTLLADRRLWHKLLRRGRSYAHEVHGRDHASTDLGTAVDAILRKSPKASNGVISSSVRVSLSPRLTRTEYSDLVRRIQGAVSGSLPDGATVAVVSKGDEQLVQFAAKTGWHFPQTASGMYSGFHPADSDAAIRDLEAVREKGAQYFLIPQTALWWLDYYAEFKTYLDKHYAIAIRKPSTCVIYALGSTDRLVRSNGATENNEPRNGDGAAESDATHKPSARAIAFYLPQFYPTPENSLWWGEGFTEWTNVTKARPLFEAHLQPHLPSSLGFYDLRVPEVRQAQADLARKHDIEAFCYWHYWFHGKRLLERPFNEVLLTGKPDFPFCLAWANETWSRRWHGSGEGNEVLQAQTYSPEDDLEHVRWLIKAFSDRRYLKVHGRPVFLIYRPTDLPDSIRTTQTFRAECEKAGLPQPYLVGINSHKDIDYRTLGFDTTLDFEPQLGVLAGYADNGLKLYDYTAARRQMRSRKRDFPTHPCVFVRWDNTPRRLGNGIVFTDSTPQNYESALREMIESVQGKSSEERLVFINAWNEWAEGNHLEPDQQFGTAYLEATAAALTAVTSGKAL